MQRFCVTTFGRIGGVKEGTAVMNSREKPWLWQVRDCSKVMTSDTLQRKSVVRVFFWFGLVWFGWIWVFVYLFICF
jgi:hypothetical protein